MFHCLENGKLAKYKAKEKPELGWVNASYFTLNEAQRYMDKYLGMYSPGKDLFVPGYIFFLENIPFQIVEIEE